MRCHPRVVGLLNRALSHEFAAAQQCALAAAQASALSLGDLAEEFRVAARDELLHAEAFALRLAACGAPVRVATLPAQQVGATREQLVRAAVITELSAVELYEGAVKVCGDCDDATTKALFERVLAEERQHLRGLEDQWTRMSGPSGLQETRASAAGRQAPGPMAAHRWS